MAKRSRAKAGKGGGGDGRLEDDVDLAVLRAAVPDLYGRASLGEVTAQDILLEAATALDLLAKRSASPADVAATRVVDALWLATRRGDAETLEKWERGAYTFLRSRTEEERWTGVALPSRAGLDRAGNVAALVTMAGFLIRVRGSTERMLPAQAVARTMVWTVHRLFPTLGPVEVDAAKGEISAWYERQWSLRTGQRQDFVDPESLACAALRAFGLTAQDAQNWVKGAAREQKGGDTSRGM